MRRSTVSGSSGEMRRGRVKDGTVKVGPLYKITAWDFHRSSIAECSTGLPAHAMTLVAGQGSGQKDDGTQFNWAFAGPATGLI